MTNLSYDPFQSVGSTSGTANVPYGQGTGSQYQGDAMQDMLLFPTSGAPATIYATVQFASGLTFNSGATFFTPGAVSGVNNQITVGQTATVFNVGGIAASSGVTAVGMSGGGNANVTVMGSGWATNSIVAANSGTFAPAGYFFIQVPTSGNPVVKVPFFNS